MGTMRTFILFRPFPYTPKESSVYEVASPILVKALQLGCVANLFQLRPGPRKSDVDYISGAQTSSTLLGQSSC